MWCMFMPQLVLEIMISLHEILDHNFKYILLFLKKVFYTVIFTE